jgi:hypothetical protein
VNSWNSDFKNWVSDFKLLATGYWLLVLGLASLSSLRSILVSCFGFSFAELAALGSGFNSAIRNPQSAITLI